MLENNILLRLLLITEQCQELTQRLGHYAHFIPYKEASVVFLER